MTQFLKKCILIISEAVKKEYLTEMEGKDILDFLNRGCRYLFAKDPELLEEVQQVMEPFFKLGREIFEEEVTERVTEEVTERVTREVTREVTKEVTEQNIKAYIKIAGEDGVDKAIILTRLERIFNLSKDTAAEKYVKYTNN